MSKIPTVKIIETIAPDNAGTGDNSLEYSKLPKLVDDYSRSHIPRAAAYWDSEPGSLEELSKARQLAFEYFIKTASELLKAPDKSRNLWADRFTNASIEIYGEPEKEEVASLIRAEYQDLMHLKDAATGGNEYVDFLLDTYKPMLDQAELSTSDNAEQVKEKDAIAQYGDAILQTYQPLFDMVDSHEKSEFTSEELKQLFESALDWLTQNDDGSWSEFSILETDGTNLSVLASSKIIKIGMRRIPASSQETRGLVAHELLVHALRAKNGSKTNDKKLGSGLAGYLSAEEGLGILAEEAVTGKQPEKAHDRYVDIALALGTLDGIQKNRHQLFKISFARQMVRLHATGTPYEADIPALERKVWAHVDRIYRGSKGDDANFRQAIFTKDIAYYVGYKKMAAYITSQLEAGKTASEVFDYLSQCMFDPLNPKHIERLERATNLPS